MILIFEENTSFQPFGENLPEYGPSTFLIASKTFEMGEIASNFYQSTGITHGAVKNL